MQDPFIPGEALQSPKQVMLQVAETEAEPKTVIRYIITPRPPQVSVHADAERSEAEASPVAQR